MSDEQPNPFTPEQLEILFQSWALAARGMGQVLEDHAIPTAYRLAERGWLECRILDGVLTWWWSPQSEAALATGQLITGEQDEGRRN